MPVSGSLTVSATDAYSTMVERVRPQLVEIYPKLRKISGLIGPMKSVEKVSDRLYRVPLLKYLGGTFQVFNPDGGALGYGSGLNTTHLTGGFIFTNYMISLSKASKYKTEGGPQQSVLDVFSRQVSSSMEQVAIMEDITLFQPGNGVLTADASATAAWASGTQYTFAGATDYVGVKRLLEGMAVNVYDTGLSANRANATNAGYPSVIDHIDYDNKIVRLGNTVTGAAGTDRLAIAGMFAVGGAGTPAYGQSGWPLSGDTFRHGIPYANETDATLYYLGRQRTTLPQISPSSQNVAASWTPFNVLLIADKIRQRRGEEALSGMFGLAHMAQRSQAYAVGVAISEWPRQPGGENVDPMPKNLGMEDTFMFGGITHYITQRQPADRVDYINPKVWERVEVFPGVRPYDFGGGRYVAEVRNSSGQVLAADIMAWEQGFDFVCVDPGCQAVLTGLTPYSGY